MPGVTEDKRTSRVAVGKGLASELIGVDGQWEGGLRPFSGFIQVTTLDYALDPTNHDGSSKLLDFFPVNFKAGTDDYCYGFVFRVRRKQTVSGNENKADIYLKFWNSADAAWQTIKIHNQCPVQGQMDVTVDGRFIFVCIENVAPTIFYMYREATGLDYTSTIPGPGKRPTLLSPKDGVPLGSITATGDAARPGAGQIFLTEFLPSETGLGLSYVNEPPCGAAGLDDGQVDDDVNALAPGDYAFAYMLFDSLSGRRSALSEVAECRTADFDDGTPDSAFWPSLYAALEICYDTTRFDQAYVYRSVRVQDAGGTYIASILHLDQIIDLCAYHTNNNPLGGGLAQSVYYYELQDKPLTFQDVWLDRGTADESLPPGGACIVYGGTLVIGKINSSNTSSSEENRARDLSRGLGELRWSSLHEASPEIFPPYNRYTPPTPSNQVIAFRRVGGNVMGFSADRQYHLRKVGGYMMPEEIHEGFGVVGPLALDDVGSMIYFVTSKGVKAVDSQGQLEDIRSLNHLILEEWSASSLSSISCAYDPWLSALFIQNSVEQHMAVLWFNTARVTEVHDTPFQRCATGVWPILNDDGTTTYGNPLVKRTFFVQDAPRDADDDASITTFSQPRVFIVDERRLKTGTVGGSAGQPRRRLLDFTGDTRFVVSVTYSILGNLSVVIPSGRTLPANCEGAWLYVMESPNPAFVGVKAQIKMRSGSQLVITAATKNGLNGLPLGSKIAISPVYFRWVGHPVGVQTENEAGQMFQFSSTHNFFRVKMLGTASCVFTDLLGKPFTDPIDPTNPTEAKDPKFRALVYKGSSEAPAHASYPRDRSGSIVMSITEDDTYGAAFGIDGSATTSQNARNGVQGSILTPGIEIMCPDIDFRLMGVNITGSIAASDRTNKAAQS